MRCPYKITINNTNLYREFEIGEDVDRVSLGTNPGCEFRLNADDFFEPIELTFIRDEDHWKLNSNDEIYISKGDVRKLSYCKISHGDSLIIRYASNGGNIFELGFSIDFEAQIPKFNQYMDISTYKRLSIGTDLNLDVTIESQYFDNILIYLEREGRNFTVIEKISPFGVQLNGKKIDGRVLLKDHDFISVADVFFYYKDERIYFDSKKASVNNKEVIVNEEESVFDYPIFIRNARKKFKIDDKPINILDPSSKPTKPEMNIVTSLLPAVIMLILVIVLRGIMSTHMGTYKSYPSYR